MATIYYCYFPTRGETLDTALKVQAHDPADAAEIAAHHKCWNDTEWEDHLVAVGHSRHGPEERFEVQFENLPHFTATPAS